MNNSNFRLTYKEEVRHLFVELEHLLGLHVGAEDEVVQRRQRRRAEKVRDDGLVLRARGRRPDHHVLVLAQLHAGPEEDLDLAPFPQQGSRDIMSEGSSGL